ncbi:hypothetical protein B8W67_06660 [Mycolicibacillus koreensis]|uniref:Lipoprotein n=1 Tax=Mycolicibacillus koreensis TaxID=1069220 RepID=A0AA91PFE5_9MYCO|nr:hypothetical protein B8W67_06660 [Mycolicibacillus koreensis]
MAVVSILTTATVALAGCSTAGDAPPAADPAALDAGNYPTEPRPDLGRAGDLGVYVEARRMADFVTMPFDVDRDLTGGYSQGAINGVVKSASSLRSTLRISVPDGAANNFVNGFTVQRASAGSRGLYLQNTVLRYGSPADARVAADELAGKGAKLAAPFDEDAPQDRHLAIPGRPESRGIAWEEKDHNLLIFTAHGPYVLVQQAAAENPDAAADLVVRTLDKQIPLIDTFEPTPVDKIPDLPLDPTGLLARTLEPAPDQRDRLNYGHYEPRGSLAFSDDPFADEKLFAEAGVTEIVFNGTDVYHARDAAGAEQIVSAWAEDREQDWDPADAIPGLDGSRCHQQVIKPGTDDAESAYACLFTAGDYAVDVFAKQKTKLRQMAAAQYLLLTAE